MLTNFLRTALRTILKYKAYAAINFLGLTTGFALALLIFAYVRSEVSYDRFHEKIDRLYRIKYVAPNGLQIASSPPPIAPLMKEFFPGVEEAGRMYARNVSVSLPDAKEAFEETDVYFADSSIMKMMTFEFIKGSSKKALVEKFTVILNEEMAKKYFGDNDPIGQTLIFTGNVSFKVAAVVKNFPDNAHLRFNMLVPYENMYDLETPVVATNLRNNLSVNFIISHSYTYVLLKPGAKPEDVDQNMNAFLKKYAKPNLIVGQVFTLFPVADIHLKSNLLVEPSSTNSWSNLYIFMGVGILTLMIACINYINLSTAQSFTRTKEIGIRKVLGSMKSQLITQFLAESFFFAAVSFIFSLAIFYLALPLLNSLTGKSMIFSEVIDLELVIYGVVLVLAITILAGLYPALFVTRFNSINALKGAGITQHGSQVL